MRIVSLQPSVSITLARLGRLDEIVGCTRWCMDAVPELLQRSTARGGPVTIIKDSWSATANEIIAIKPDLVIASVPYRMESLAEILKAGVPVLALAPHCLADIYSDIRLTGGVVDAVAEVRHLVADMEAEIEAVRQRVLAVSGGIRPPLVYCEEWGKPLIRSQPWVRELVLAAGGDFVGEPGGTTTAAEVAEVNPDVMVFAWCGAGSRVPLRRVVEQRGWQNLQAVRERRVFCIADELLNTPAPTLVGGLRALAAALWPRCFDSMGIIRLAD